jgi:hypothetical protein
MEIHASYYAFGDHVDLDMILEEPMIVIGDTVVEEMVIPIAKKKPKDPTVVFTSITDETHKVIKPFWTFSWRLITDAMMSGIEWEIDNGCAEDVFGSFDTQLEQMFKQKRAQLMKLNRGTQITLNQSNHDENQFNIITAWGYSYYYGGHFEDDDSDWDLLGWVDLTKLTYVEMNSGEEQS